MLNKMKHILILITLLLLNGCNEKKPNNITANDLAKTLGIHWSILEVPNNNNKQFLGIRVDVDGVKDDNSGGSTGWENEKLVKAFVWKENNQINYSIIGQKTSSAGSVTVDMTDYSAASYSTAGAIKFGDPIITYFGTDEKTKERKEIKVYFGLTK